MANPGKTTQTESGLNELERLRDILYGQQARNTEERLNELNARQEAIHTELVARIDDLGKQFVARIEALQAELNKRLEQQGSGQSQTAEANKQALTNQMNQMQADTAARFNALQTDLEKSNDILLSQIQALQNTSRQADAELSEIIATLDEKKVSRQAFGQILAELAERLQKHPA